MKQTRTLCRISEEIKELQSLLAEIPQENAIERIGFEARLKQAQEEIAGRYRVPTEMGFHKEAEQ